MKALGVLLALVFCFGCTCNVSEQKKESAKLETDGKTLVEEKKKTLEEEMLEEEFLPPLDVPQQVDSKELAAVVDGNNRFAFDLYRRLGQKPGNKFFSPYSISTALGMTYAGAGGNTAKEMAQTLHFTLRNEQLHPAFGELIRKVNGADKKRNYEFAAANSLWANKTDPKFLRSKESDLSLDPRFLRTTQADYQADFQFVDFRNDAEMARQAINGWVEDKTNSKIADLIPRGFIKDETRLILINAIYFKGQWSEAFPATTTKPDDFTIPGTPAFKVPMMNHQFVAGHMENADFQLAQFMYKDNDISMVVILPKKKDGLPEVEKKLSAKALSQALGLLRAATLHVTLPKFKITEQFSLGGELKNLGMQDAFLPKIADFKGMETGVNWKEKDSLYLSDVVHKAFVDVDEKGTEAAAATAVEMFRPLSMPIPPPLVRFRADHPFLFLLRHNATGSILFLGRMSDPRGN